MTDSTSCCRAPSGYCERCDLLLGLPGLHVVGVQRDDAGLRVEVESVRPEVMGCPACGVIAHAHGRQRVELIDAPCFTVPVRLWWRKRRWLCPEPMPPVTSFMEQDPDIARPRALLTARATLWAIGQMRRENASVQGMARQLGCTWRTLWRAVKPILEAAADNEKRFAGVTSLGVDEHIWHHVSAKPVDQGGRGPKEFTGMVDLTRDKDGRLRARLLDLVPGRSSEAYTSWLRDRGDTFRKGVEIATLDPFHGYRCAIDDQLDDAIAVLDAFHVVRLGTAAVDEGRRRVQQDIHGHRGRRDDPLYRIRNLLRAGKGASHQPAEDPPGDRIHHRRPTRRSRGRLALRPTAPLGLSPVESRRRPQGRGEDPCLVPVVSDPGDRPPRPDAKPVARRVPGLLHHRRRQQRRNRSHQRVNRTPPPHRPRFP